MLAESKGLSTNELGSLLMLYFTHTHLACIFMLLRLHLDVVLRKAPIAVVLIEGAVATVEDVSFRVGEVWVAFSIDSTVLVADMLCHERGAVSRVFAVKDQQSFVGLLVFKQLRGELVLVIEVHSAIYVATLIFVLEATVNDHSLVVQTIIFAIENIYHGITGDAWKITCLIVREEMRQLRLIRGIEICYGSKLRDTRLFLLSHDLVRMLEHAQ